jgi:hypothetical protein
VLKNFIGQLIVVLIFSMMFLGCEGKMHNFENEDTLIGHWSFNEMEGGAVKDLSGKGNHLYVKGEPVRVDGVFGGGFKYDSGQSYFTAKKPVIPENDFTISLWAKADNWDKQFFMGQYKYLDPNRLDIVARNGCARIQIGKIVQSKEKVFVENRWYHIVYTRTGTTVCIYVDSKEVYKGKLDVPVIQTEPLEIGRISVPKKGFACDAAIDEVRIYSRGISCDEVKLLFDL